MRTMGWPIFLHPVYTIGRERLTRFYLRTCSATRTTPARSGLPFFGGVMDAFPKLEVNLPHGGGTFPGLIGRLDHGTRVRAEMKHMKQLPSEYLRRFTYDTIGHDDRINLPGAPGGRRPRVLGSDYCFDMGLEQPVRTVERLTAVSEPERDLILGKTAARLLGIG